MSSYADREGVWVTYEYEVGPYVMKLYTDVTLAAKDCAKQGFGNVLFWPFGMVLQEAIEWWTEKERHPLSDSIVHFFYESEVTTPICKLSPQTEWVMFDHTAVGKICLDCQDRIGRKVQ